MCDICGMIHCPPECPEYEGEYGMGDIVGHCVLCEETIYSSECALEKGGELICGRCAAEMTVEDVLAVEQVDDSTELLRDCLGWRVRT